MQLILSFILLAILTFSDCSSVLAQVYIDSNEVPSQPQPTTTPSPRPEQEIEQISEPSTESSSSPPESFANSSFCPKCSNGSDDVCANQYTWSPCSPEGHFCVVDEKNPCDCHCKYVYPDCPAICKSEGHADGIVSDATQCALTLLPSIQNNSCCCIPISAPPTFLYIQPDRLQVSPDIREIDPDE